MKEIVQISMSLKSFKLVCVLTDNRLIFKEVFIIKSIDSGVSLTGFESWVLSLAEM